MSETEKENGVSDIELNTGGFRVKNTSYWKRQCDAAREHVKQLGAQCTELEDDNEIAVARCVKAESELAAIKADDSLTVAYMSGFHDGKKAAINGKQEPVAWMNEDNRTRQIGTASVAFKPFPESGYTIPLYLHPAPIQEVVIDLLDVMFTAYEDGVDCYEDPDDESGYVGKAIKLDDETFHKIADLLNNHKPRNYVAAAPKPEEG